MAQSRGLYLRVGALVLAGLGLTLGFVLFLTANRPGDSASMYEAYLREPVQGLEVVRAGLVVPLGFVRFRPATRPGDSASMYETYLRESVQGLEVGAAVRYRGVNIGRVEGLGLVSAEYRRAEGDTFGPAYQLVFVRFSVDTRRVGEG